MVCFIDPPSQGYVWSTHAGWDKTAKFVGFYVKKTISEVTHAIKLIGLNITTLVFFRRNSYFTIDNPSFPIHHLLPQELQPIWADPIPPICSYNTTILSVLNWHGLNRESIQWEEHYSSNTNSAHFCYFFHLYSFILTKGLWRLFIGWQEDFAGAN